MSVHAGAPSLPEVVFDLRAGGQTGLGRVAHATVAAFREAFPDDPVTVVTAGGGRYSWRAQREWPALRRAHPHAIWVWFHWDVPLGWPPARSIVYLHDLTITHAALAPWAKRVVARLWMQRAVGVASRVVTVSEASAAAVRAELRVDATVIPNGVGSEWFVPWTPREYLLTVGEPRAYKNVVMAERVAAALGVRHVHAWKVPDDELRALYAGARVVLMPSRAEGFGLPVLEAFAAGAPVVASDIPALREVGGSQALYASPDDLESWCTAVRQLWSTGGDAEERRRWASRFTWGRAAGQLREVVRSLDRDDWTRPGLGVAHG